VALVEARPAALSKAEIQDRLWPDTFVSEGNLSVLVAELRAALGDVARRARFIRTVHRFGYAFCGDATTGDSAGGDGIYAWLVWDGGRVGLRQGDSLVGRDPEAAGWFDAPGISRRHARIRLQGTSAELEDLRSKNGTYVGDARVTGSVPLADGDRIRIGPMLLTFRLSRSAVATRTEVNG
jgi:hypothetical protein